MTVTHTVSAASGSLGRYYFSASAQWHTMPFWRFEDSVGSCAQNIAIDPGTQGGYYSYHYSMGSSAATSSGNAQYNITEYQNVINGNWYGSAGLFSIPVDYSGGGTTYICTNLFATYHFYAYVSQPTLPSYFNSVGSYDHRELSIGWNDISINIGGEVSASIGLSPAFGHTRRSAEVIIYREG